MSASSKKKLRKEQNAAQLTEKQRKEQSEAKKLKINSIIFIVIMVLVVVTALTVMVVKSIQNSGILEKNTVVATVGEHEINSVEANYYFTDLVSSTYNEWYSTYGDATASYMSMMGLDLATPLDEQPYDDTQTWADYFLESALDQAKADYALYDAAMADGHTLTEDEQSLLDSNLETLEMYSLYYGYSEADEYLRANYGAGANMDSYRVYAERSAIASSYYSAYYDSLSYEDADIRAYEEGIYNNYTSYTYATYYVNCDQFLPEGNESDPTEEEISAASAEAKAVAESLLTAGNVEELDAAIAALEINADNTSATSNKIDSALYTHVSSNLQDWIADPARQENDIEVIPLASTSSDTDGNQIASVSGYYVVLFQGSDENTRPLANVRHLLVKFEGGTTDDSGTTVYSDEEKAAAKAEAEGYLQTWRDGEATEESFIELVKEYSDDSSASTGGLFEDITPTSSYVTNFLNWSIDESRVAGDAEVIETEYGYHVMYYVGDDELTYRDYMIANDMKDEALENWYDSIVDPVALTMGNSSRVNTDLTIDPNS